MTESSLNIHKKEYLFCESILYLSDKPAFIWSGKQSKIYLANQNGERFLGHYSETGMISDVDMDTVMPEWRVIPAARNNSSWLNFIDRNSEQKTYQVRNSCLNSEEQLWATVLLDEKSSCEEQQFLISSFILKLETLWNKMTVSALTLKKYLAEFSSLFASDFFVTDFFFYPSPYFEKYDIYPVLQEYLDEKYSDNRQRMQKLQKDAMANPEHFISSDTPENDKMGLTGWGFYIKSEYAGYFCIKNYDKQFQESLQTVCEFLAEKWRQYAINLELKKENYITHFENDINNLVIANINEGVIITDSQYSIMYLNTTAAVMFGYQSSQVIGHRLEDLLVTSDGIQHLLEKISDEGVSKIKYLHRRSGKVFPCQINASHMNSNGKEYYVFVLTDQTETEEIRLKTEQLTQRAFIGDFASLLAHEIRNPINNMIPWIANINTLAEGNSEIQSAAARIEGECERISQLVSNILSFSKPIALNKEEIDLALLLSEIIEKWRLNFVRKNIKCYFTPPKDFPKFLGDPRSLEQVLNNLIGNSVDALSGQDGIITLKLSLVENDLGRRQIQITESDNGQGIPEDKIEHIFEPFVTTKKNGNGWGLAISKRIITSHKGTIQVESFQDGTVFKILLPLNNENG